MEDEICAHISIIMGILRSYHLMYKIKMTKKEIRIERIREEVIDRF